MIQETTDYLKSIEVEDAEIFKGTCEVCECEPEQVYKDNDKIEFQAQFYHQTENLSIKAYYIKHSDIVWSHTAWFSAKYITTRTEENKFYIKAPVWYLKLLKINIEKLTILNNKP